MTGHFSDDFPMQMEREVGLPDTIPPVNVAFGMYPMLDKAKSDAAGRDVFVDVEHVKIAIPGDKTSLYFQPAQESHRRRFPKAYAAYKDRDHTPVEGTPIENWAAINRAAALTLRAAHIPTVEAFVAVHEGNIDKLGISNARELQAKAKAFLAQATDNAATLKLAAEKKALEDRIAALEAGMKGPPAADAAQDAAAARKPRATAKTN